MPHDVLIVTEAELRAAVPLDLAAIDTVERAFAALHEGGVVMPPVLSMAIPAANGEVDVKTAYIPGFDGFAIKVSPGFFDNPKLGLPSLNGLMILFSAQTGLVQALFLDNGYLTDVRTAAAGAVAARHLAPADGRDRRRPRHRRPGPPAAPAAHLVRPFTRALVWGRDPGEAPPPRSTTSPPTLGIDARPEPDPARLVAESQLVVTTTPARAPILMADWLHPGLHVTAMGSDQHEKNEIDPAALARADAYVCDRVSQSEPSASCAARSPPAPGPAAPRPSSAPSSPAPPPAAAPRGRHHLRPHRHRRPGHRHRDARARRLPCRRRRHRHAGLTCSSSTTAT